MRVHRLATIPLLALVFWSSDLFSQTLQPLPGHSSDSWNGGANRWRWLAQPSNVEDTLPTAVRAARNAYWKTVLKPRLDVVGAGKAQGRPTVQLFTLPAVESDSRISPELPDDPGLIWLVAKFTNYKVIHIDSDYRYLYTEVTFKIEDVAQKAGFNQLIAGSSFDVDLPGGRIKLPSGQIVMSQLRPEAKSIVPGGTYLLCLLPSSAPGAFFIRKSWDLSTGTIAPMHAQEIQRSERGESILSGKSKADAFAYLRNALP